MVIALVLWFLFWVTNAFAMVKPPYPPKGDPPGQIVIVTDGHVGPVVGTASKPK